MGNNLINKTHRKITAVVTIKTTYVNALPIKYHNMQY